MRSDRKMSSSGKSGSSVTAAEMKVARDWTAARLAGAEPPFSFRYGGQPSVGLIGGWKRSEAVSKLDARRTQRVTTYIDPSTRLQIRCVAVVYRDFPVVEWTVYFKNTGRRNTPIIDKIQAVDLWLNRGDLAEGSPASRLDLHYHIGSPTKAEDYQPLVVELKPGDSKTIATSGGRACNAHMPFFNLEWSGSGLIMAVGWGGQWAAEFGRDKQGNLRLAAGQELTHFTLHPGEEIRTPLIALLFYQGDHLRSQNIWRRWIIVHNMPRPGGSLPNPQIAGLAWLYFSPWGISNALAMKIFIDHYEARKIPIDAWWTDAGWYACNFPKTGKKVGKAATGMAAGDPSWPNIGTWEADPYRFPRGVREVSDHAHAKGLKTILWFEPERVMPGTWLAEKHPEWLITPPKNPGDQFYDEKSGVRLLDLGNPDALRWLINHIDELLTREGIDVYREDFNMDPLYFWRAHDTKDRQGITEIRHVMGHFALWDELRRRHPNLLIDNCSSGCKRADLESMRRSVVFWRTDYMPGFVQNESALTRLNANQCITYGIASWIPYYGGGMPAIDKYYFRSLMCPSIGFDFDPRRDDLDLDLWRHLCAQFKQVAKFYFGDYYPLTPYSLKNDAWMAWQFHCPEKGAGMVQVFRREACRKEQACFKLRGLQPDVTYAFTNPDDGKSRRISGRALMEKGLKVEARTKPAAMILTYKQC